MSGRAREIEQGLASVRSRIARAAERAGRAPEQLTLVAVSKTWPHEDIRLAYEAGQRDFGENYAQELAAKREALSDLTELRWHFIGALQSNKARLVVPGCVLVHAVDRASVAQALSRRAVAAGVVAQVLVEVNVSGEGSKAGVTPRDADVLANAIAGYDGLSLAGLMCVPAADQPDEVTRAAFRRLRELRDRLAVDHPSLTRLSMGMSHDFELAIEEGATHVRVGSAIFGARAAR